MQNDYPNNVCPSTDSLLCLTPLFVIDPGHWRKSGGSAVHCRMRIATWLCHGVVAADSPAIISVDVGGML
jgi:hypothetical protein